MKSEKLFIYAFIYLCIYLFIYLLIYLFFYLFITLFIADSFQINKIKCFNYNNLKNYILKYNNLHIYIYTNLPVPVNAIVRLLL